MQYLFARKLFFSKGTKKNILNYLISLSSGDWDHSTVAVAQVRTDFISSTEVLFGKVGYIRKLGFDVAIIRKFTENIQGS